MLAHPVHLHVGTLALGTALLLATPAAAQSPEAMARQDQRVSMPDAETYDWKQRFGLDFDVSGDRLLVSDPKRHMDDLSDSGVVYAYERDDAGVWQLIQSLQPSVPIKNQNFGWNLAVDGDLAVIGGLGGPDDGFERLWIFEHQGAAGWTEIAHVPTPVTGPLAWFDLWIEGRRVLLADSNSTGSAWTIDVATDGALTPRRLPTVAPEDEWPLDITYFGQSACFHEGRILIGASGTNVLNDDDTHDVRAGIVFVYEEDEDGVWQEVHRLQRADHSIGTGFGVSFATCDDRVFVGCWEDRIDLSPGYLTCGSIYEFRLEDDGSYTELGRTFAHEPAPAMGLGVRMTYDSGYLLATSRGQDGATVDNFDRVHAFQRASDGTMQQVAVLFSEGANGTLQNFGYPRLVTSDGTLVASTGNHAVYAYETVDTYELGHLLHGSTTVSLASGGQHDLWIRAGLDRANAVYLLAGSASGSFPGFDVWPGVHVPLQFDAYSLATLVGTVPIAGRIGILDGMGRADAALVVPASAPAGLAGIELHHAFMAIDLATWEPFASNAAAVTLVP